MKKSDDQTKYEWQAFNRMRSGHRGFSLVSQKYRAGLWIPRSAFSSSADEAAFTQMVKSHLG